MIDGSDNSTDSSVTALVSFSSEAIALDQAASSRLLFNTFITSQVSSFYFLALHCGLDCTCKSSCSRRSWQNIPGSSRALELRADRERETRRAMKLCTERVGNAIGSGWWPEAGNPFRRVGKGIEAHLFQVCARPGTGRSCCYCSSLAIRQWLSAISLMAIHGQIKPDVGLGLNYLIILTKLHYKC